MNADIFQAALAATARVACCAALVSCQKPPITPENPSPQMEHAAQQEEKPVAEQQPQEPKIPEASKEFIACNQTIQDFLKIEPSSEQQAPEAVLACCDLQGYEVDQQRHLNWEHRMACCDFLEWQGPKGCTPWGPPVPPHMV